MIFNQFVNFVTSQPADRKIVHLNKMGLGTWSVCAVGDFVRECLQEDEDTSNFTAEQLEQDEPWDYAGRALVMRKISFGGDTAPDTYGELSDVIARYHPELVIPSKG